MFFDLDIFFHLFYFTLSSSSSNCVSLDRFFVLLQRCVFWGGSGPITRMFISLREGGEGGAFRPLEVVCSCKIAVGMAEGVLGAGLRFFFSQEILLSRRIRRGWDGWQVSMDISIQYQKLVTLLNSLEHVIGGMRRIKYAFIGLVRIGKVWR